MDVTPAPANWLRAMRAAGDARLRTFKLAGADAAGRTGYMVMSASQSTDAAKAFHVVWVGRGAAGKIEFCEHCPAQEHGVVCKHKGAVARRLIRERRGQAYLEAVLADEPPASFTIITRATPDPERERIEREDAAAPPMETARTSRRSIYREEAS